MPVLREAKNPHTQIWLPLLPQRGLITRDRSRMGLIQTIAIKSFAQNVPAYLSEREFLQGLLDLSVGLRIDTEPSMWPDFESVDVVLCARRFHDTYDDALHLRKPPTKLVNAWAARTIPLVSPEAGYLDIASDGTNAIVVSSAKDVLESLAQLKTDPDLLRRLEKSVAEMAPRFSTEAVLNQWEGYLLGNNHRVATGPLLKSLAQYASRLRRDQTLVKQKSARPHS